MGKKFTEMTNEELRVAVPQACFTDDRSFELFREQIAPYLDESEQFSFDGDGTCNDCNGDCSWDGIDRRCNCGNRRVSWAQEHGQWVAEAY